nr:fibropellin-1-like [Lytechinus pictus]
MSCGNGECDVSGDLKGSDECRIYWFTAQGVIESVDFNGTDRRVHFNSTSQVYRIRVIRKFGDVMYFGDMERKGLGAINLTSGEEVAYASELQKKGGGVLDIDLVMGLDIVYTEFVDYCCMWTCEGGGTCVNHETEARCICTPTLNGTRCELDVDECLSDPFPCDLSHGVCNNTYGSYFCGCESGYWIISGIKCIEAYICDGDDACLNGGTCNNDSCACMYGFIGNNCEFVDCDINPCKIGSTCSNDLCQCQPGFKGSTCESIDCNIDPCMNGAVCESDSCTCPDGYIGLTCWYKVPRTVHNVTFFDADPQ